MTPSVGKKLGFFVATVVILATGALGYLSYTFIEARFAEILRKDTLDASTLLASRIRNELRHVAEKGRILTAAALEEFKNPDDQIRFLEENLSIDDQFVALSLFRRSSVSGKNWAPVFRLARPDGDPARLTDDDFKSLDLKYPLDFAHVSEGAVGITVGALRDGTPVIRLAVPIVKAQGKGFTQILGVEVRQERITAAFAESTAHFSYVVGRTGRVLAQTDPTHFTLGEDVSHLPILQMMKATEAPNGSLDFHELPGGMLQYGSFHRVGYAELTVISQATRSHIIQILRAYARQTGLFALACAFLALTLALIAAWGIVGHRLRKLGRVIENFGEGDYSTPISDTYASDEIGDFARTLQDASVRLAARDRTHGTFDKFHGEPKNIDPKGEKSEATVFQIQLNGLTDLIDKGHPDQVIEIVNDFTTKACAVIEKHKGIVDRIQGGLITAFWGMPVAESEDAERALTAALEVRELAKELGETLKKHRLPALHVAMGMDHSRAIAGSVGTGDRQEYTVFGEAFETASRIVRFTDQFGTDFLMTGRTADRAPKWFSTSKVASEDGGHELYELVGSAEAQSTGVTPVTTEEEPPSSGDETTDTEAA